MAVKFFITWFFIAFIPLSNACECGLRQTGRIISGTESDQENYPWYVYLRFYNRKWDYYTDCGGAIIDNKHILTAAHCALRSDDEKYPAMDIKVYLSVKNKTDKDELYNVSMVHFHSSYNIKKRHHFDIALLRLTTEIEYTRNKFPLCLAKDDSEPYVNLTVVGFGYNGDKEEERFMKVGVSFISREKCNQMKYEHFVQRLNWNKSKKHYIPEIHVNHMCAQNLTTAGDACVGDSGGPLMYESPTSGRSFAIGIVSASWQGCGNFGVPGLYTIVKNFREFIMQIATNACWKGFDE